MKKLDLKTGILLLASAAAAAYFGRKFYVDQRAKKMVKEGLAATQKAIVSEKPAVVKP